MKKVVLLLFNNTLQGPTSKKGRQLTCQDWRSPKAALTPLLGRNRLIRIPPRGKSNSTPKMCFYYRYFIAQDPKP